MHMTRAEKNRCAVGESFSLEGRSFRSLGTKSAENLNHNKVKKTTSHSFPILGNITTHEGSQELKKGRITLLYSPALSLISLPL